MKRHFLIWLIVLNTLTSCNGQTTKYFEPTDINDRTKEFISKGKWISLADKERIDGYTRIGDSIFGGEIACNIKPLQNIDIVTFKVLPGTQYAKDKNYVYYPLVIPCDDYTDCGVCYYSKVIIEGANPTSFRYLGKDYATDGKYVFFRGKLLQAADGATFNVIEGPEFFFFATDKNNVYKHDKVFPNADPKTFFYNNSDPRNKESDYDKRFIISDKDNTWEYIPPHQIKKIKK
ncbi:DKNYY domain-containing protein [Flavobacterium sp. CBA20B-1]|uniref:DKNYY domain-containing protein n=1 Tax=unclassified Flavobacterium TaxID=196869 RepID=UPI0022248C04|nr:MULTISPECIES: DKNYY domain-containing protein [unclassified Flavobacterium]WCM42104.1 DKNYY domain-containing protein [Flavobacterium sp. CBA20B-1]